MNADIPRSVEDEVSLRGYTYFVARERCKHDGAGQRTKAVDHHRLAGSAQLLIAVQGSVGQSSPVICNPNRCLARARALQSLPAPQPINN